MKAKRIKALGVLVGGSLQMVTFDDVAAEREAFLFAEDRSEIVVVTILVPYRPTKRRKKK